MVKERCVVPCCGNNSLKNPKKLFIRVPQAPDVRKLWYDAINPLKRLKGAHVYVCEDHFNLETDAENLIEFKLMKTTLLIKKDIVPYLNLVSNTTEESESQITSSVKKRKAINCLGLKSKRKLCFDDQEPSTSKHTSVISLEDTDTQVGSPSGKFNVAVENVKLEPVLTAEKEIQVCLKPEAKNKQVQTNITKLTRNIATQINYVTRCVKETARKPAADQDSGSTTSTTSHDSYVASMSSSTDVSPMKRKTLTYKQNNFQTSVHNIENHSRLYLGLPETEYFLIKILTTEIHIDYKNILISLKKIRLNDTYKRISVEFGVSSASISPILSSTIPKIAYCLKDFIYWPDPYNIKMNLPVQFSIRYREVQSVIDCLEIEIQTPSNPYNQAQTWTNYKKCNTAKYLISAIPSGFINFISKGYGGRTTDADIVEKCGFLEALPENCSVMADRGFKNISHLLLRKNYILVRPPSTTGGEKMTKEQVTESKRIAALRIHIERVIRRLREFKILSPHACIHSKLIPWLDDIIIIVCGIVNLQGALIK